VTTSGACEAYPPVAELVPHTGAWVLLSGVLEHQVDATTCLVIVGDGFPFRLEEGRVSPLVGLEYMAQCVAVHGALRARREQETAPVGLLMGMREVEVRTEGFAPGQHLEVTVRRVWGAQTFFTFDCSLRDGTSRELLMKGNLQVFRATQLAEPAR
jgi:predicted hotdog family 3-hydroxylacyl-ACP dehydratase